MNVLVIGGGMITRDQILPSLLHLQKTGRVDDVQVCSRDYRERLPNLPARSIVFIATPDHLHFEMTMDALNAGHHVICVKPLALRLEHAQAIAAKAREAGLFVGVEYHKRFDDRSLMARRLYRAGEFGDFRMGTACLLEKWNYRDSNFQNWFDPENTDAFTYIGCHYVDLVAFITGLTPVSVSLFGIIDRFPNGKRGYLWTDARVIWSNGACLNVQNALGYPNAAPGTNAQGLTMYCTGGGHGALIAHSDQYRGLKYSFRNDSYTEPSPDYFQLVEWEGEGLRPVGYGYRSIEALVEACARGGASGDLLATPENSSYNEAVIEAARESLQHRGAMVPVAGERIS